MGAIAMKSHILAIAAGACRRTQWWVHSTRIFVTSSLTAHSVTDRCLERDARSADWR